MSPDFDQHYFNKYFFNEDTGEFDNYQKSWFKLSYIPHLVEEASLLEKTISTALILGSATGECLQYLEINKIKATGIELSEYAQENSLKEFHDKTHWGCVTQQFPKLCQQGLSFDLIFSSCLHYLDLPTIEQLLGQIKGSCYYFSHYGGFQNFGDNAMDLKIKILEPYPWWVELFNKHGFTTTLSPYIWKSF
ncbi:MAG: hypothetical protein KDD40_11180 [Bdellovibrionales bacterium]|nr:hypothetical protein [Bdellovibrionales bacterium]